MVSPDGQIRGLDPIAVDQHSIRSRVTEALRASIIAGDMEPGKLYSAPALADMLHVSATPVREAMIDLTREGLVVPERNKGYRVMEHSAKSLDDLTDLRALIEVPAMMRVAAVVEAHEMEALRGLADEIVRTAEGGLVRDFIQVDIRFHLALLAFAGNQWIVDEVHRLRNLGRMYGLVHLAETGKLVETAREHHELLDLLKINDVDGVGSLMERHIGHIRGVWAGKPE